MLVFLSLTSNRNGTTKTDDDNDNHPITSKRLKKAIEEATEVLGKANRDAIVDDLQRLGIELSGETQYSLNQIRDGLRGVFGEDATSLLMERIRKSLD